MIVLIFSFIFCLISLRNEIFLWFFLPFGVLLDLWNQKPLGTSTLKLLIFYFIFWLVFGKSFRKNGQIKF